MQADSKLETPPSKGQDSISLPQEFFPDFLCHVQNADGGWGYRPGLPSSTEPTALSIFALRAQHAESDKAVSSASEWLRSAQSTTGAWPTADGEHPGCWVTALACLALLKIASPSDQAVAKGLQWICGTWPAEGNMLWRIRQRWSRKDQEIVRLDPSLRGWGWTPETASWVEPTACALLLLKNVPEEHYPQEARKRIQLGERMLYDRVCPGGGWNAGNPLVYGVPGLPRIGPTVWALLALSDHKDRNQNMESLEWLEQNYVDIQGPGSLALAHLCLRVYGHPIAAIEPMLSDFYRNNQFLQSVLVTAWASLAAGPLPDWLELAPQAKGNL